MRTAIRETSIGWVGIAEEGGLITHLFFGKDYGPPGVKRGVSPLLTEAFRQLNAYLAGHLKTFLLPLAPAGTPFQKRVWNILVDIPYGQTASYKDVAVKAGNPQATRAVGMANNRNPIAIIIPCHRVIGSDGRMVGYGGGLDMKVKLLALEGWPG